MTTNTTIYTDGTNYYTASYLAIGNCSKEGLTVCDWYAVPKNTVVHCTYNQLFRDYDQRILNNQIISVIGYENFELFTGADYDEQNDEFYEFYQYFIINEELAESLAQHTNETVYYCPDANLYVLAVDHFGTSWNYVSSVYVM